jgi:O-acetylserine/cysteine efflux transporter
MSRSGITPRSAFLATLVAALWGSNFVAIKLAIRDFPPLFLLVLRFAIVAALMVPWVRPVDRRSIGPVLAISFILGVLHFGLSFLGVQRLAAGTAAVVGQLSVPFSALLAVWLFGERLDAKRVGGILLALLGVAVLARTPHTAGDMTGVAFVIASALAWAVANSIIKRYGPFDPYMLTAWMALFAVPQLLAVSLITEHGQWQSLSSAHWSSWTAVGYTALGSSILGYGLWYHLVNTNAVSKLVPFTLLAPVFAVIGGLFLGEPVTAPLLIGGALTVAGVGLCELRFRRLKWFRRARPDVALAPD